MASGSAVVARVAGVRMQASPSPRTTPQPARPLPRSTFTPALGFSLQSARLSASCRGALRVACADLPTVADTKRKFLEGFPRPIPSIYNSVIQELLVQQHLVRFTKSYKYDPVFALGFCTVYDQLMDGFGDETQVNKIFDAYIKSLEEDPSKYRADATALEEWASQQSAESLASATFTGPAADLAEVASRAAAGNFQYSKFFAIGVFRILELAKAATPETLAAVVTTLNISKTAVDRDLDTYRGLLNKLKSAKELLRDFLEREKRKQAERAAGTSPAIPSESSA